MNARPYDVIVIGAGPGGSTLAAMLAGQHQLRVALVERDVFPRQHIGESLTHRAVTLLEESGALPKVMASRCWVRKYGGYYAWNDGDPAVSFFEHANWERDGILRWAIHVNRAEFDSILLDHARDLGVEVFEGRAAVRCEREGGYSRVVLADGQRLEANFVADVTGRQTSVVTPQKQRHLSSFKNVALWTHILDGKSAQSIDADWNLFRSGDLSAIGSFAFEDGWFWYIPVPMLVDGERVETHSLGMVTDPLVLKERSYRTSASLLDQAKQVPLLRELVQQARPVREHTLSATNYSMISPQFCNYDEGWMLIGDAAGFVDPLFSSGVTLSMAQANAAAKLLQVTLCSRIEESYKRALWAEYETEWREFMHSFAASIDQWYHAIAINNPDSVYWQRRIETRTTESRMQTFRALVDSSVPPDVLQVLTKGSQDVGRLMGQGPLGEALQVATQNAPSPQQQYRLAPGVAVVDSVSLGFGIFRNRTHAGVDPELTRRYWEDPVSVGQELPPLYGDPIPAWRAVSTEHDAGVLFPEGELADRLRERLVAGGSVSWAEIHDSPRALGVALARMMVDGLLIEGPQAA